MKRLFVIDSLKANNKKRIRKKQNSFDANEYANEYNDYNYFHDVCENNYDIYNDSFKIFDFEKRVFDENVNIKNIDFILSKLILLNKNIFSSSSIIDANSSFINSFIFFNFSRNTS